MASSPPLLVGVAKRRSRRARVVQFAIAGDDEPLPKREMPEIGKMSRADGAWHWNRGQIRIYDKARAHVSHLPQTALARYYYEIVGRSTISILNRRYVAAKSVGKIAPPPAREEDLAAERLVDGLIRAKVDIPDPNAIRGWMFIEGLLRESEIPPTEELVDLWVESRLLDADVVLRGEVRNWLSDRLTGAPEEESSSSDEFSDEFSTASSASSSEVASGQSIADLVDERVNAMFQVPEGDRDPRYDADPAPPRSSPDYDSGPPAPVEDERERIAEIETRVNLLERRHDELREMASKAGAEIRAAANRASAFEAGLAAVTRATNDLGRRSEDVAIARAREAMRDGSTDGTLYRAVAEVVGQMMDECKARASARDRIADRD